MVGRLNMGMTTSMRMGGFAVGQVNDGVALYPGLSPFTWGRHALQTCRFLVKPQVQVPLPPTHYPFRLPSTRSIQAGEAGSQIFLYRFVQQRGVRVFFRRLFAARVVQMHRHGVVFQQMPRVALAQHTDRKFPVLGAPADHTLVETVDPQHILFPEGHIATRRAIQKASGMSFQQTQPTETNQMLPVA